MTFDDLAGHSRGHQRSGARRPTTKRPRTYTYDPPPGVPRTTTVNEPHTVPIRDARPIATAVSLDREGFGVVEQRSAVRGRFYNEDELVDYDILDYQI